MLDLTKAIKMSDIVTPEKLKPISKKSPGMTGEIMKGVTDVVTLIKNIEKYSDDNKLSFGKRIPYTIYTTNATINVAQAYFINDNTICAIGWSPVGLGTQIYEDGKVVKSTQDTSTYVLPVDRIHCVAFGSYDPEQIKIEVNKEVKMTEKELEVMLNDLKIELSALNNTGWDRDFIIKAKTGMIKTYMLDAEVATDLFKNHRIIQLTQDIARLYHDKLENIIYYFLHEDLTNFMFNYANDKELIRKYRFFKTEEERLHYIEVEKYSRTGSHEKNTFTFDEVKEFAAFFEDEALTKSVEDKMTLPEKKKVEVKLNGSDEVLISIDYYEGYENNPGIPVFQVISLIPDDKKVKAADAENTYDFIGISTVENATITLGLDSKITESTTVYPVFRARPIKEEEPEPEVPPVVEPEPTEPEPPVNPDNPYGGDDNGDDSGNEGGGEPEPEPEPDPEEEDEDDEPEPEDEDPEESPDDEDEDDSNSDDTEESDKTDNEE